jgi:hypothetical protein
LFFKQTKISASLYYPGRGDNNHVLSQLHTEKDGFIKPDVDDHAIKSDGDWHDDEQIVKLSLRNPSRFSEVMAIEVSSQCCLWYLI